ncbi:efflux RND transporter periplasmic adaptor subunit [Wohlfahrtiimonas chitiniclastica]|uniref:efflux RND transporter periplasmic adaptor subunit n=1 Tax=Wohlfahrtiimonas chitiniclastica TaxID=400946 RepID=UPI001BCDB1C0|nr:efflux RND transporter periplasmic adaptor subunit [Wohlfahrtiimonas chitiniclastica]MBS7816984.1 efflux RND transporter periplasmic adaptor subunit [Wohlfahrtiimonas chitiniclastica]MBS7822812.1 efflux RND transporter periplasmic adaptor subunit [Wohlfahrtiimonas chitiniclastica]MBS7830627.1 efflux RND transporter periplasmic adaptor subunit [Wohlfahrtiimonas chitiniclastica]MBS7832545.1 efflux RND transporter periplasmic adaptor subunit [Wohlfahrtiimonas chitiniclastica]
MMRKLLSNQKWLLVMAGALALSACSDDKSAQQAASVPPVKVVTYTTQAQDVLVKAELPGRTKASKIAEVRPQVGGIILNRHFVEGSYVEEGTTLYQIDPAIYDAALQIAEAKLEQAKANQYAAAEKAKRINALSSSKAVSKQDVDDANAALIQANAQVAAAKAEVNNAEISLNYTKMLAPISGQIGRSNYTQGALVTAGQAMEMAVIQQNDPMRVDITYSAKDFTRMQKKFRDGTLINPVPGAIDDNNFTVHLVMDDGSIYPQAGIVKFSDRTVDPTTGSILIQAEFPNPDQLLLPGMFVRSIVDQGIQKDAIQIPQKAIYRDPKGQSFVIVVGEGNIAEVRPVEIEHANGNNWLISKGLNAGEKVVVEGIQQVQSMMRRTDKVPLNIANDAPTQTH